MKKVITLRIRKMGTGTIGTGRGYCFGGSCGRMGSSFLNEYFKRSEGARVGGQDCEPTVE